MKKLLLFTFVLSSYWGLSQTTDHMEHMKCGHLHQDTKASTQNIYLLNNYDVNCYFLDIEVGTESAAITGNTSIYATTMSNPLDAVIFELNEDITIDSLFVNDSKVNFERADYVVTANLSNSIAANTAFSFKVFYNRPASLNTDGIFNYTVSGWDKKVTYTLSEPFHAREWFPCKQDLLDKADSVYVFVTMDTSLKAGSNGLLTNITPVGTDKHRYEWKSYYPIAYYLISIAVADYEEYNLYANPAEIAGDSILVQNYLYRDYYNNESIKEEFNATDELIELFSDKYSLYPFWEEKYGHSFVPLGGAMEHQTMTSTGTSTFYINAHELGHQWFGDNVTCASWQDIWVNEGFASYSEYLAYEFIYSEDVAHQHLINAQDYARQRPSGSVYIPFDEVNDEGRIFDWYLTYRKGLCLVHMIRSEVNNDDEFFELLKGYQTSFADSVATGDDLMHYLTDNSSHDFTNFFDEWYYGEGFPRYTITWQKYNDKLRFIVDQITTNDATPYFTTALPLLIDADGESIDLRLQPNKNNDTIIMGYMFDSTANEVVINIDPDSWILKSNASTIVQGEDVMDTVVVTNIANDKVGLTCYPNPMHSEFYITAEGQSIEQVMVYDMQGREIFNMMINDTELSINSASWSIGTYNVKVLTNKLIENYKIIKQ